ncbi:MAG TPA: hypothetical protein DEP72_07095 [Clostridiales bacterium]|nr:MAG: hypothetical protein A2Y18_00590 [Clostridiales bacterium GWD2_32_19]HCC07905.1 hypothetical protein [Clostridiales bacterium]
MKKGLLSIGISIYIMFFVITSVVYAADVKYTTEEEELRAVYEIKDMMDTILENYVGGQVSREELVEGALKGMYSKLDPYSTYYTKGEYDDFMESVSGEFVGIGVKVEKKDGYILVDEVLEKTPAEKSEMLPGDVIIMVNGEDVKDMTLDEALSKIKGLENTKVILTIKRGADTLEKQVIRDKIQINAIKVKRINEIFPNASDREIKKMRYIMISEFNSTVYNEFRKAIEEMKDKRVKGLIIDLRNNPGGYLDQVISMCKIIIPEGPIVHTIDKQGAKQTFSSELKDAPFNIVVIVNENTASASEILTGAIKDSKVGIVVGEKTFGKGVVQKIFRDIYGNYFKLTVEEYLTRNGTYINKIGITPDIIVEIPDYVNYMKGKYKLGDQSEEVEKIEKILIYLGYEIKNTDKNYEQDTYDAIAKFQKEHELFVYGVADYTTQASLNEVFNEKLKSEDKQLNAAFEILKNKVFEK